MPVFREKKGEKGEKKKFRVIEEIQYGTFLGGKSCIVYI